MRVLRMESHRRVANVIAAKSMNRKFIGTVARWTGSIPVGRALDSTKPGRGKIYLPSPTDDPLLVRGVDTDFEKQAQVGGLLVLPTMEGETASSEILEIHGPAEIRLKKEFKGDMALRQLTGSSDSSDKTQVNLTEEFEGTTYKTAPKIDQSKVYDSVFHTLEADGGVLIFPEGGSHDRTELLPLKRGSQVLSVL